MVKKLFLILILVPFLFIMGCNLSNEDDIIYETSDDGIVDETPDDGIADETPEDDIIYETPDAALIYSYYAVTNVITEAFEVMNGDYTDENTGIIYFSNDYVTVNGTESVTQVGLNTKKTYAATIDYSDFSYDLYFLGGITGSLELNAILTTDAGGDTVGGSSTLTGSVAVSGFDNLSTMEFDIAGNFDSTEDGGDVNIDGKYYHAADLVLMTSTIIGIWEYLRNGWRDMYILCDDGTFYFISRLNNAVDSEDTGIFTYTDTTLQLIGDIRGDMGIIPYTLNGDDLTFNGETWSRR